MDRPFHRREVTRIGKSFGLFLLIGLFTALAGAPSASATICMATNSGDWNSITWSNSAPVAGDDVVIKAGVTVTLSNSPPYLGSFTNNGTLIFTNWDTTLSATTIAVSAGMITHTNCSATNNTSILASNRVSIVCSNLTIASGASINTDGKGYYPVGPGCTFNAASRSGAGYGGAGGPGYAGGGPTYGSSNAPVDPGSTGNGQATAGSGSPGGGAVLINASGTVTVNGSLTANGLNWGADKGGGSGGSLYVNCSSLAGIGTIQAKGGDSGNDGVNAGGGGGGRIACYVSLSDSLVNMPTAPGGIHNVVTPAGPRAGLTGTVVRLYTGVDPVLTVSGSPTNAGSASPYLYGNSGVAGGTPVTENVTSPANQAAGRRYECTGWSLRTNGFEMMNGSTTQAVFSMPSTNATLIYAWTNMFELGVSQGPGGTASTNLSGWYTNGTPVTLTVSPSGTYYFTQWTGDVPTNANRNATLIMTMDQPRYVTANFASTTPTTKTWGGVNNWMSSSNWTPPGMPGYQDSVAITSGTVTLSEPMWVTDVLVSNGATLLFTNWNAALNAREVTNRGTITHGTCSATLTTPTASNRVAISCSNLTVVAGASINVDAKGYAPTGPGTAPTGSRGGGCYGGVGGRNGWSTYGSVSAPLDPGSGGQGQSAPDTGNGPGGGAVRIDAAGNVQVDGTISANGKQATGGDCAGGSGGGIHITCQTISGAGAILANGAQGQTAGAFGPGGGGGGRVAVIYTPANQATVTPPPSLVFSAAGGAPNHYGVDGSGSSYYGTIGTLYFTDSKLLPTSMGTNFNGTIYNIPSWSPGSLSCTGCVQFADANFQMSATNGVVFSRPANYTYKPVLQLARLSGSNLFLDNVPVVLTNTPVLTSSFDLVLTNGATLVLYSSPTNAGLTNGAQVTVGRTFDVGTNCWVYPVSDPTNGGSVRFDMMNLIVASNAGFNADAAGFVARYNTSGLGPGAGTSGGSGGTGGGYGGEGGRLSGGTGGNTYGSSNAPVDPGSAGHSQNNSTSGRAGGAIRIAAIGTVQLEGSLRAIGGNAPPYNGGGSGGGIYVTCRKFIGAPTGSILANGGTVSATNYWGCGGGGGRIAVWRIRDINGEGVVSFVATGGFGSTGAAPGYPGTNGTVVWGWTRESGTLFVIH